MSEKLKRSDYFFELPKEFIAQTPLKNRSDSKLLYFNATKNQLLHKHFYDLPQFLRAGDVLVLNEAKVAPVRLIGKKQGGNAACEVLLLKRQNLTDFEALVKPGKRLKNGAIIEFSSDFKCEVIGETDFGGRIVRFSCCGVFENELNKVGQMPLPHYIKEELRDKERYNTIYSKIYGSSAAPTAGLHFTNELLEELKRIGVTFVKVLLNIGLDTFRPVKEDNILNHAMHNETYEITEEAAEIINKAKSDGRRIVAVGTTSVRTLEASAKANGGKVKAEQASTDIFIHNDFTFKVVDALITNFHLPESTLVMLVASFIGYDNFKKVYKEAVENKYRFFSFGDACFFERKLK